MAKAAKEKTELPIAPQNDSARGSWHTATAGMYTKEGLAELRSSQAFTPKPSGSRSRERMTRGGVGGVQGEEDEAAAATEQVFAGDEAEMVHEAGQQGDLKNVSCGRGGVTAVCCNGGELSALRRCDMVIVPFLCSIPFGSRQGCSRLWL